MQHKGVYYTKLIKAFTLITLGLTFLMLLLFIMSMINMNQHQDHMINDVLQSEINTIDSALNYITETANRFTYDKEIISWIEAQTGEPEYYFSALKIYQKIRDERAFQNYLDIEIAITGTDENSFVISPSGTKTKEEYFKDFPTGISTDGIFPVYSDGKLDKILLVKPRIVDEENVIFASSFSIPGPFVEDDYIHFAIHDEKRDEYFSSDEKFLSSVSKYFDDNYSSFSSDGYTCDVREYPNYSFTIIYGYKNSFEILPFILISIIFIAILTLFIIIFSKLTKNLYKPVDDVISWINHDDNEGKKDEFAIIMDNCQKIEYLNTALENALDEQYKLSEQQKYRAFIRGIDTSVAENDNTSAFLLALAVVTYDDKNASSILAHLDTFSKSSPHMHFIRTSTQEGVLIQKADTPELAEKAMHTVLGKFIASTEGDLNIKFALADTVVGYKSIPNAMGEAREIIQYRYRVQNKAVLTHEDIKDTDAKLYFPFSEENKLISMLIAGKEEALDLFDQLSQINVERPLLPIEFKKFTYSMIGITNRFFLELKEDPKELIGREINWSALYSSNDSIWVIKALRKILSDTIESRKEANTEENNQMIDAMKDFINQHYMENIMLVDLSEKFNLTPKYCSYLFSQLSNDNFKTYLNKLRIEKACEMIDKDPNIKISYLSQITGFTNANTFIRVFSKYKGVTPKLYAMEVAKHH